MLCQHLPAERIDLDVTDDGHSGALQAQVEAANTGEQGEDVHAQPPWISARWRSRARARFARQARVFASRHAQHRHLWKS
jgi:hypothetical protein